MNTVNIFVVEGELFNLRPQGINTVEVLYGGDLFNSGAHSISTPGTRSKQISLGMYCFCNMAYS